MELISKQFEILARRTDLRVFTVFDQGLIQYQKNMIYEGLDVLIGTPKRRVSFNRKIRSSPATSNL